MSVWFDVIHKRFCLECRSLGCAGFLLMLKLCDDAVASLYVFESDSFVKLNGHDMYQQVPPFHCLQDLLS